METDPWGWERGTSTSSRLVPGSPQARARGHTHRPSAPGSAGTAPPSRDQSHAPDHSPAAPSPPTSLVTSSPSTEGRRRTQEAAPSPSRGTLAGHARGTWTRIYPHNQTCFSFLDRSNDKAEEILRDPEIQKANRKPLPLTSLRAALGRPARETGRASSESSPGGQSLVGQAGPRARLRPPRSWVGSGLGSRRLRGVVQGTQLAAHGVSCYSGLFRLSPRESRATSPPGPELFVRRPEVLLWPLRRKPLARNLGEGGAPPARNPGNEARWPLTHRRRGTETWRAPAQPSSPPSPPTPVLSLGGPQVAARHETVRAESRTRRHIVGHQQVVKAQHQTEHAKYLINVTC